MSGDDFKQASFLIALLISAVRLLRPAPPRPFTERFVRWPVDLALGFSTLPFVCLICTPVRAQLVTVVVQGNPASITLAGAFGLVFLVRTISSGGPQAS